MATIATERLRLRTLAVDDAVHLSQLLAGDWGAIRQTGRMPYPATVTALRAWIELHLPPASHAFLVIRAGDALPIGAIGFGGDGEIAEIGYIVGRHHRGQGYATESVLAMIELAPEAGFGSLEAFTFLNNPGSERVLEKTGFDDLGTIDRNYPKRGGLRQVRHFRRGV